jgi:hypothetical protein
MEPVEPRMEREGMESVFSYKLSVLSKDKTLETRKAAKTGCAVPGIRISEISKQISGGKRESETLDRKNPSFAKGAKDGAPSSSLVERRTKGNRN